MDGSKSIWNGLVIAGRLLGYLSCAGILFAMFWMVGFGTNSLPMLAQAGLVCALPLCLFYPLARRLCGWYGEKRVVLFANLALVAFAVAMVLLAGESALKQEGLFLYLAANGLALALLLAAGGVPCEGGKRGLGGALLQSAGGPVAIVLGMLLCAMILESYPFRTVLFAGAVCAALGAGMAGLAKGGRPAAQESWPGVLQACREGLRGLFPTRKAGVTSACAGIGMMAMLPLFLCYILLVSQYFAGTIHGVALVAALFLAGKTLACFVMRLRGEARDTSGLSNYILMMVGVVLLVASILRPYPEYLGRFALLSAVLGVGYGLFFECYVQLIRRNLPEERRPRAAALVTGYFHAALAAGLAAAAVFGAQVTVGVWFLGAAAVVMAAGFIGAGITNIIKE